jgi:hypothetical protein
MNGRPLEEIAAFQWESSNRIALDDLAALPRERWHVLRYDSLVAEPAATIRRLCEFADIEYDEAIAARVAVPLPHSRQTQTPPSSGKWRRNAALIDRVLPGLDATWRRLRALD